jgi:hypothetical protein
LKHKPSLSIDLFFFIDHSSPLIDLQRNRKIPFPLSILESTKTLVFPSIVSRINGNLNPASAWFFTILQQNLNPNPAFHQCFSGIFKRIKFVPCLLSSSECLSRHLVSYFSFSSSFQNLFVDLQFWFRPFNGCDVKLLLSYG